MGILTKIGVGIGVFFCIFIAGYMTALSNVSVKIERANTSAVKKTSDVKDIAHEKTLSVVGDINISMDNYIRGILNDEKEAIGDGNTSSTIGVRIDNTDTAESSDGSISTNTINHIAESRGRLSSKDIEDLKQIGREANDIARRLQVCQTVVESYRKAVADLK